ncbi:MAG: hypothetical protein ABTR92_04910 [Candidatus Accumulibacter phosphatis]|uniref:hypothetical protein n=1 Tax=Candidatus Accumulibacter sp. ACC012 TaxID=2823332 RepID=UPI0025C731A1|nr:hypothetical protein [Candidatus Accumulibacter sp. ACC012]
MSTIQRRLNKLEGNRDRNDVGREVDNALEKMGTSRAAMLADFGTLTAFRDWLATRSAATDHQAGVPISAHHRKWQGDSAVSVKWDSIFDQHEALQTADTGA